MMKTSWTVAIVSDVVIVDAKVVVWSEFVWESVLFVDFIVNVALEWVHARLRTLAEQPDDGVSSVRYVRCVFCCSLSTSGCGKPGGNHVCCRLRVVRAGGRRTHTLFSLCQGRN